MTIEFIFHKCVIMFLDEQFTYEHSEPETSKQIKEKVQASTVLAPKEKDAEIIKIEISKQEKEKQTAKEIETSISSMQPQSPKQIQQSLQSQQKHQSEHRASIASAPAATVRSSSISTITGVC